VRWQVEFGTRVMVRYESVRVIGEDEGPLMVRDPSDSSGRSFHRMIPDPSGTHKLHFHDARPYRTRGRYRTWDGLDDPIHRNGGLWPGHALPLEWIASKGTHLARPYELEPGWGPYERDGRTYKPAKAYARIRRFACGSEGLVIGQTWRDEGQPESPRNYGEDSDPGSLTLESKVPLFEVVLDYGKLGKATIVLAHVNDLDPMSDNPAPPAQ
jgi:hypothetical protein